MESICLRSGSYICDTSFLAAVCKDGAANGRGRRFFRVAVRIALLRSRAPEGQVIDTDIIDARRSRRDRLHGQLLQPEAAVVGNEEPIGDLIDGVRSIVRKDVMQGHMNAVGLLHIDRLLHSIDIRHVANARNLLRAEGLHQAPVPGELNLVITISFHNPSSSHVIYLLKY
jgi:hypothetical protein